jgi:hypothetical protein
LRESLSRAERFWKNDVLDLLLLERWLLAQTIGDFTLSLPRRP